MRLKTLQVTDMGLVVFPLQFCLLVSVAERMFAGGELTTKQALIPQDMPPFVNQ